MIYLDNNATTRVAPEVFDAMRPYLTDHYGNPSSAHTLGRETRKAIELAREQVSELIEAADPSEIVFTSCGSESDNWAIRGVLESNPDKRHVVTTRVEHEAVRKVCERLEQQGYEVSWLDVNQEGELDLDQLRSSMRADTALVSIMLANNETGVLFPINEIGQTVRESSSAVFHVDGVQAVGKIPIKLRDWNIDLFALSGHKFYAPKGVGALYIRTGVEIAPLMIGGGQESGRRAGTESVPYMVALGRACELARLQLERDSYSDVRRLRDKLEDSILANIPNSRLNGARDRAKRLPNTSNISFEWIEGESIMAHLDEAGICVSTGSACHSTSHEPSAVLRAMNVPYTAAQGSIRFSLGRYNTESEIDRLIETLPGIINRLAEISPYDKELSALFCGKR